MHRSGINISFLGPSKVRHFPDEYTCSKFIINNNNNNNNNYNNNNNNNLILWLTEPGGSIPHSQGFSMNPEPNQSSSSY